MNIFVTGGAGYVGSHCVRALCDGGHKVVVYDNLISGGHREAVDPRATLIVGDLGDTSLVNRTLAEGKFDAVMHFAALAEVTESVREPLRYYRNNVVNSVSLLEAMRTHNIKAFVFSSSCAAYGIPSSVPIKEDMRKTPISPYGRSKLAIEWAMEDSTTAWGLGATALRYFNAAGAAADGSLGEDHTPESHLIPRVLQVALGQSDRIKIFGMDYPTPDGTCIRDYVHVEDLASIHANAVQRCLAQVREGAARFRCYNVGTGSGVSVMRLIEAAREVTGHDIPASPAPPREGDPPELYADPTLACTELGWQARYTDIRRTLQTAWNWHRTHPHGYTTQGATRAASCRS